MRITCSWKVTYCIKADALQDLFVWNKNVTNKYETWIKYQVRIPKYDYIHSRNIYKCFFENFLQSNYSYLHSSIIFFVEITLNSDAFLFPRQPKHFALGNDQHLNNWIWFSDHVPVYFSTYFCWIIVLVANLNTHLTMRCYFAFTVCVS